MLHSCDFFMQSVKAKPKPVVIHSHKASCASATTFAFFIDTYSSVKNSLLLQRTRDALLLLSRKLVVLEISTANYPDHCQNIFPTIETPPLKLDSVESELTGETGICLYRILPVGVQKKPKPRITLSSACNFTVRETILACENCSITGYKNNDLCMS